MFSTGKRSNQTKTKRTFSAIILPQICLVIFLTNSFKQVLVHNIWGNQPSFTHLKWNMDDSMACVLRRWGVQNMAIFPYLIHNIKMVPKSTRSKKNPNLMFPCLLILQVSWWNIDVPTYSWTIALVYSLNYSTNFAKESFFVWYSIILWFPVVGKLVNL